MSISDRQTAILGLIRSEGRVEVDDLAGAFAVTPQTIRRDLSELCDRGLAARTHGGARRILSVSNVDYQSRRTLQMKAKEEIGRIVASLVPDNCSVTLNIGTTTEQVARALSDHSGLVVLSNNVNIITSMMSSQVRELILVGGSVRQSDGAIVGGDAVEFISRYKTDYAVVGASALDDDGAVLDFDAREVSVARAILRNARTRILVCDISKFQRTAPIRICEVGDLDYVVMDEAPPAEFRAAAEQGGARVLTPADLPVAHDLRAVKEAG